MKKIRLLTIAVLLCICSISEAQLVIGDVIIEPYWGLSSGKQRLKRIALLVLDEEDIIDVEGMGPFGIRGQYMVSEDFGIGLDVNYTERSLVYRNTDSTGENTRDELGRKLLRVMVRTSWVFYSTTHTQLSWDNSIGYRYVSWSFTTNRTGEEDDFRGAIPFGIWPLALRSALTFRYLFIPNFGAFAELGISGGSFLNVGLSGRF